MTKTLNSIVLEILQNNNKRMLNARELTDYIRINEPEFFKEKMERTNKTEDENLRQIYNEIIAHYPQMHKLGISRTADRPQRYYYAINYNNENTDNLLKNTKRKTIEQNEHKLYPILAKYCYSLGIQTLRIDEKRSNKKGGKKHNIWLHADIVGFKDLSQKYNDETRNCFVSCADEKFALYSFEVKDGVIESSKLREYFFQTVSNSSWANYSYIVAEGIEDSAKEELQLLCASFKIGYIQLDKDNPIDGSDVIIKAPKTDLDWDMINRISIENPDFRQYLYNIPRMFGKHSSDEYKKIKWDIM